MAFNLQDYETVESRLDKWWKDYPDGRITTKLEEASAARFIVSAQLYKTEADAQPYATGLASEVVSDRGVNSTSALENAETSAIGRASGLLSVHSNQHLSVLVESVGHLPHIFGSARSHTGRVVNHH